MAQGRDNVPPLDAPSGKSPRSNARIVVCGSSAAVKGWPAGTFHRRL